MRMQELIEPLEFTPEQLATADEEMPGWREWTPQEFRERAPGAIGQLMTSSDVTADALREVWGI